MPITVALLVPGNMGAAVGGRLRENGATVLTSLAGRSPATIERARRAGLESVADADLACADILLSIVPPGEALATAGRMAPHLAAAAARAVYVDCNAVSPETVGRIAEIVAATGAPFVDAGIIGGPPLPGRRSPVFYASGDAAERLQALGDYGLDIRVMAGGIGAASALKMAYAGITKGLTALGAATVLAASRAGVADALKAELADSQPELLAYLALRLPDMFPKAYRWVAEMEEIGGFVGPDAQPIYQGAARLYGRIARDEAGERQDIAALAAFARDEG